MLERVPQQPSCAQTLAAEPERWVFLRKLGIDRSEDAEPDPCEACDGTGQTAEDLICPTCRGLGYFKT